MWRGIREMDIILRDFAGRELTSMPSTNLDLYEALLAESDDAARIVDIGGGTGGFAVPLAQLGHRVEVIDPSPDALAALDRRAREADVADRRDGATGRDGATTLRLVNEGRLAAVIRIDGSTVQVDAAPGTGGERWQAALSAAPAERLRTTSRGLSP